LTSSTITTDTIALGLQVLAGRDFDLAKIWMELGTPPIWEREPGFATLLYIILEQQVSLSSARAAFQRLQAAVSPLTPQAFLQLDDHELKVVGFSRQKTGYGRILARAVESGELDLEQLVFMDDDAVREALMRLKGIGRWTADIYLLMALLRPDVWPAGDLALAVAVQQVKDLDKRPSPEEMEIISIPWKPWRAVAARLLWEFYLNGKKQA
jgi:DNA-3-methyladenine glycosylase II